MLKLMIFMSWAAYRVLRRGSYRSTSSFQASSPSPLPAPTTICNAVFLHSMRSIQYSCCDTLTTGASNVALSTIASAAAARVMPASAPDTAADANPSKTTHQSRQSSILPEKSGGLPIPRRLLSGPAVGLPGPNPGGASPAPAAPGR